MAISADYAERPAEWRELSLAQGADPEGHVWPGRSGDGPMSPSSVTHVVERVARRAGLVDAQGKPIPCLHGLRHSAGSLALTGGVPLTIVSAQLRHSRPDFTARVYSHLLGDGELDRFAAVHAARTLREDEPEPEIADG